MPDGATSVAEHCLGMILALTRHIATSYVSLKEGRWEPGRFQGTELHGKTLGVIGLGRVDTLLAGGVDQLDPLLLDGLTALGRHTVAAFLNAHTVDYGLSPSEVVDKFNDVFPGSTAAYNALKDEFEELIVQHYGRCAIARSRYRQRGRMGRHTRNTTYRMTDVWIRLPEGWKLQARHAQPVAGD